MSSFTAPLWLAPSPPHHWATTRPFRFWSGEVGEGLPIDVEAGYRTDLGSIPKLLWGLFPPHDPRWAPAFVAHDKLCDMASFPRIVAAALFLEMLEVLAREHKAPRWRVWAMFAGVMAWALVKPYGPPRAAASPSGSDSPANPPPP